MPQVHADRASGGCGGSEAWETTAEKHASRRELRACTSISASASCSALLAAATAGVGWCLEALLVWLASAARAAFCTASAAAACAGTQDFRLACLLLTAAVYHKASAHPLPSQDAESQPFDEIPL